MGTGWSTRGAALRQWPGGPLTRASRERLLPTEYGHAARSDPGPVTCEYQSDLSSKHPASSVAPLPPQEAIPRASPPVRDAGISQTLKLPDVPL
jgi:hypothetical protein